MAETMEVYRKLVFTVAYGLAGVLLPMVYMIAIDFGTSHPHLRGKIEEVEDMLRKTVTLLEEIEKEVRA